MGMFLKGEAQIEDSDCFNSFIFYPSHGVLYDLFISCRNLLCDHIQYKYTSTLSKIFPLP